MKLLKIAVLIISYCMLTPLYAGDGTRNAAFLGTGGAPAGTAITGGGFWYRQNFSRGGDVAMQGTKIILIGTTGPTGATSVPIAIRLNPNGTLDTTFGSPSGGITTINSALFGGTVTVSPSDAFSVTVLPDNAILIACGLAIAPSGSDTVKRFGVVKLTATGALDTSFNASGSTPYGGTIPGVWYITASATGGNPFTAGGILNSIGIQSTGKIILGGYANIGVLTVLIVRLNTNGTLDTDFNKDSTNVPGMWYKPDASDTAETAYFVGDSYCNGPRAVAIQSNDRILVATTFTTTGPVNRTGVMRLLSTGVIDTDFNPSPGGDATYGGIIPGYFVLLGAPAANFSTGFMISVAVTYPSGNIVAGGTTFYDSNTNCLLTVGITPNGRLNTSYNAGGSASAYGGTTPGFWVITRAAALATGGGGVAALTFDPAGRVIFVAHLSNGTAPTQKTITGRLTAAGKLDTTFNPNPPGSGSPYGGDIAGFYYFPTTTGGTFQSITFGGSLTTIGTGQILVASTQSSASANFCACASIINKIGILQDTATPFNTGSAGLILTTTIDQNSKLLAGGNYGTNSQLTRYNVATTARDTSFSGDGVALGNLTATAAINKVINNGTGYLVAGVSNTNQFTTASFASDGTLNSGYGTSGIVRETGVGVSAAYDMLLNGTALAVSGYTTVSAASKASVINYHSSTGARNTTIGDSGWQIFNQYSPGVMYGISTTTGTRKYGAGQDTDIAFVGALADTDGVLQDTAAPFNTGAAGLIYSTTITQTTNILAAVAYNSQWYVVNYTSAGARNNSFGLTSNGIAEAPGFSGSARPRAIAVDSTGRIIAAGTSVVSTYPVFTVVRYLADGTVDEVVQEISLTTETTPETSALGILVNDDDSITVAGNIVVDGQPVPIIIDYDSNMVQTNVRQFDALAPGYFFAYQQVAGKEYGAGASEDTALLFPLLDGTGLLQDTEAPFDGDHSGRIYSGCINENDIITLCGNFNNTWMVVQYTGVGERSIGFNSDGVVLESSLGTANAYAIIQDSSGNFYVAGESTVSGTTVLTVAKYNSAGALVTTFGTNGIIQETRFGQSRAFNLALNPNGSLLIAGQITVNGTLYAALLAYDVSGQPITSFGINGAQTYQAFGAGALYATTVNARYVATSAGQTGDVATLVQTSQDATADAYIHSGL